MSSKFRRITGIILGTKDIKDYDKMVIILSPEIGKANLVAYGGNRFKSRFSNKINSSNIIKGLVRYPNSLEKLPSLEDVELLVDFFGELKKDPFKIIIVNFIIEVINLILPPDIFDEEIYNVLIKVFRELLEEGNEEYNFITLMKFCIVVLKTQGILPFIKNESISDKTKRCIIKIIKGENLVEVERDVKVEFIEWFSKKISPLIPRKLISVELLRNFI